MQESFEVSSSSGNYRITVGNGLLDSVVKENLESIFLIDQRLESCLPESVKRKIVVLAEESNKSLESIPQIIAQLRELSANRDTQLVAIGGGVIQDVATFVASVYMRGIRWRYMPTTLLGMVDSCIGGKSSINVLGYKNLVGNFYPPEDVLIDIDFAKSLNTEQMISGLYESVKICYARDAQEFNDYLAEFPGLPMSGESVQRVVLRSLLAKKWFIEIDEFDQKERLLLNYGHTFGHAIEAATNFGVAHGIAVGLGMLVSIEYSTNTNALDPDGLALTSRLSSHIKSLLTVDAGEFIKRLPKIDIAEVISKFDSDKKHRTDQYRIVIPREQGALVLFSEPKNVETRKKISDAYVAALSQIGLEIVGY